MQHIVVRTARPHKLIAPDWAINGVGRNGNFHILHLAPLLRAELKFRWKRELVNYSKFHLQ